ncbi:hypothetical protein JT06_03540 [Desulfobulbus sp. Tol-SR]|nr:hypothetical protein JT06_03540 [Desulfobulbus sp. Tol-SR]
MARAPEAPKLVRTLASGCTFPKPLMISIIASLVLAAADRLISPAWARLVTSKPTAMMTATNIVLLCIVLPLFIYD